MSVRIPKYRRHKPSGQALVEIAGRRRYLGKYNSDESREAYRRLIAELMSRRETPLEVPAARRLTINELVLRYYRFAKTYYVKRGRLTDEIASLRAALRRLRALYGRTSAGEFGPRAFKAVREAMTQEKLSRKYINDSMARVRRMFRWAVAEELLPVSAYQALTTVPGLRRGRSAAQESRPILPVADDVIAQTLPHLSDVVADMIRLQQLAGMRPAEVCLVRPVDLDRSGEVWTFRPESHKSEHVGKQRVVFLGPQAQAILHTYLARDPEEFCFSPRDAERTRRAQQRAARQTPLRNGVRRRATKPVRAPGDCYTSDSYRRAIHRACDQAFLHPTISDIPASKRTVPETAELRTWQRNHRWSPNRLRHAAATKVRREFGLEAAQVILGHSAADVTQIYAERDFAKGVDVAMRIG